MNTELAESNGTSTVSAAELIRNPSMMAQFTALAEVMAAGNVTVPKHLQKSTGDCFAIVMQAASWGMNPFAVAQKTHLVNGVLGYEAQLVNAVIQSSGLIKGRFHYEYKGEGDQLACRVGAIFKDETELVWGEWLEKRQITTQNSPLWKTNPRQQLSYLQVKNWGRLYCPGAILGVYSADELQEVVAEKEINPIKDEPSKPVETALKTCTDENFVNECERWRYLIESGQKTPDALIAFIQSKWILTDEQKNKIHSWVIIEGELA
jgi:hypothetical protein